MASAFAWRTVTLAGAALLTSCGAGTGALAELLGRRGSPGNAPSAVSDVRPDPAGIKTSPLSFSFELTDPEGDPVSVDVHYTIAGGSPVAALLTGNTSLSDLQTSASGTTHVRAWDFANQLMSGTALVRDVSLVVSIRGTTVQAASADFDVGNDAPSVQILQQPTGELNGPVLVNLRVADSSPDPVTIVVEYDRLDDGLGWRPASSLGAGLTGIATTPQGVAVDFVWDVVANEPGAEFQALLRFTPSDGLLQGVPVQSQTLSIDNNLAPVVIVNGSAFLATSDTRRGIPVPFEVEDAEGDAVNLVFQWRTSGGTFPSLPSDPSLIAAILSDPEMRRQYQIASDFGIGEAGSAIPTGPASIRLPVLLSSASVIPAEYMIGRKVRVLRAALAPIDVTSTWGANPLSSPVATLPVDDGDSMLVLDRPQPGQWRLQEVAVSDGSVARVVATGMNGDPHQLARMPGASAVLVATSQAGFWQLVRVDDAGTAGTWYATSGANVLGEVRGLVVPTTTTAAVTVGDSLVVVDRRDPMSPTERVVLSGLATPSGVTVDPRNPLRLYLAERDWVDPATSAPDGRLVSVNSAAGTGDTMTINGLVLRHPSSLAMDPSGTNMWFLTDDAPGDGMAELAAVRVNGGVGGPAFQISGALPEASSGIAMGPHSLMLVCVPGQDAIAVGGGIAQVRTITSWDPSTAEATVDVPFSPVPMPGNPWRIEDTAEVLPAGGQVRRDTFLWDSRDAPPGYSVVLRATPMDSDVGLSTDTGVPRAVQTGLQVAPSMVGAPPANAGVRSLVLEDIDGNGLLDILTADSGGNTLSVFLQVVPGVFPSARDFAVSGGALTPLHNPTSVVALDADGDGDLDFACGNLGSDAIAVVLQTLPQMYSVSPVGLGNGLQPMDVAAARLDADSLEDLVVAYRGSDELQLFFQLPSGGFNPAPSVVLTDPNAMGPIDVQVADLDGDGDLDIVSCNELSSNVCVFLQTAPGVFDTPASFVIGGIGLTDSPVSVAVSDFDGDGRPDIATANRAGNNATVFHQQPDGTFLAMPSVTLSSPQGPTQPVNLTAADVDANGANDLIVSDSADRVLVFVFDPTTSAFLPKPLLLAAGGLLSGPTSNVTADLNGDGWMDLVLANKGASNIGILLQKAPGDFRGQAPSVLLGGSSLTPGVRSVSVADFDRDGDLDLVTANESDGSLAIFPQLGPSVFASEPTYVLGDASSAGATDVIMTDLDSDGRPDVVSANAVAGTLTLFHQSLTGGFDSTPSLVLGSGALSLPKVVRAGDLDGDGDIDLACAAEGSSQIAVFFQAAPGTFPTAPDILIGGPGNTQQVRSLLHGHVDGDGLPDLACVTGSGNTVAVFLASGPGIFPVAPSDVLTGVEVQDPAALAVGDLDGDGTDDFVVGNSGSDLLASFQQLGEAVFPFPAVGFGAPGMTDDPSQVLIIDLDRDGDNDVISVHPGLDVVALFFNSH